MIMGDFNEISGYGEKEGGRRDAARNVEQF